MNDAYSLRWYLLGISLFLFIGCASQQPLSSYARAGDTVMISLGGTDSNALVPVLKESNITVTITDSVGAAYGVNLRRVFRVYADPTSRVSYYSEYPGDSSGNLENSVPAHQGQWMAILDLVTPGTSTPLPLVAGPATLSVSSPDIANYVDYSGFGFPWANGNLNSIPIEILDGVGARNPLNNMSTMSFSPINSLTPVPQVEVTMGGSTTATLGGGRFTFQYDASLFSPKMRVTTTTPDPGVQLASNKVNAGDGSTLLHVMVTNPKGFRPDNEKIGLENGKSMLRDLRFNLIWGTSSVVNDANWQDHITLIDSEYVDVNGTVITTVTPVMTKVR